MMMFISLLTILIASGNTKSIDWFDKLQSDSHSWFGNQKDDSPKRVPNGCGGKPADVYFVMDTSDDVTTEELEKQKDFASNLVNLFYMNQDTVRIGVVSYGAEARTVVRSGVFNKHHQIRDVLDVVPRIGGKRNTAKVLDFLRNKIFTRFESRTAVGHVVIMLTSGYSTGSKAASYNAKLLKHQGVYIFSVAVSQNINRNEISNMASSPTEKFVFSHEDLQITESLIELLHIKECDYQVSPPFQGQSKVCEAVRPVDVIFGVENMAIGSKHAGEIISFVYDMLKEFDNDGDINTGLILSKSSTLSLGNKLNTITDLQDNLEKIRFPNMVDLLKRIRRTFSRGRKNVQKTAVIFMDDKIEMSKKAKIEAKRNKFMKIETYVVYIGHRYEMEDLKLVANGYHGDNILIIPSYDDLLQNKLEILKSICRGF